MNKHWRRLVGPLGTAAAGLALLAIVGCGGSSESPDVKAGKVKPVGKTGTGDSGTTAATGRKKDYKVIGYAPSVKGRVTYNGDAKPEIRKLKPTKDEASCPMEVEVGGWYVNEANKGVKWAVVFLKPPKDGRMPKASESLAKPAKDVVEMVQPHCQFEPRVLVMHPAQKLIFVNDSMPPIAHDSTMKGPTWDFGKTLPAGQKTDPQDPAPSDAMPYKVSCQIHTGTMGAFIWRPTHPYAVVTDADGNFELKDVPVLEGGKMILAVWHEELPADAGNVKEFGELDLKVGESMTKDVAIPK